MNAWGEVIDLNGVNLVTPTFSNAIQDGLKSEQMLQQRLLELVKLLGVEPFPGSKNTRKGSDDMSSPQSSYVQGKVDEITKLLSQLKRGLPSSYQHKVDKVEFKMVSRQRDAPEVPTLSDEAYPEPILGLTFESARGVHDRSITSLQPSFGISPEELARQRLGTPETRSTLSQRIPSPASDIIPSTDTPSSILNSPNNHSSVMTPNLADSRTSIEQGRGYVSPSQLSQPNLIHTESDTHRRNWDEAHGAILVDRGIVAKL